MSALESSWFGASRWKKALRSGFTLLLLAFCAAPTPGDIGGCGSQAEPLSPEAFFAAKAVLDCARCDECGLSSRACTQACSAQPPTRDFAVACVPVVHDGDVCLHALSAASCDEYAAFVRDRSPSVPNECNFCPKESP
ncbi:MAG TPA: hypothetical protein VFQ61_25775 [Polyangiaceae bacterium]|nr:hypothetical protein [Polyangiaceae bacterium]